MVADLFQVQWAAPEGALQCLAQNGIEWLLHFGIQKRVREAKGNYVFHLFEWLIDCCSFLEENWCKCKCFGESLEVALARKDVYWQTNVEDALTSKDVLADFAQNVRKDFTLFSHFLFVNEPAATRLIVYTPLVSPNVMVTDPICFIDELSLPWHQTILGLYEILTDDGHPLCIEFRHPHIFSECLRWYLVW